MRNCKGNFRDLAVPRGGPEASEIKDLHAQTFGETGAAGRPNPQGNSQIVRGPKGREPRLPRTYPTRRRQALARVEKALRTPTVQGVIWPQVPPEAVGEAIRLTFYRRPVPFAPGYQWTVDVPFDLPKPDIVRLLLVRHRLEEAKKGTPANV